MARQIFAQRAPVVQETQSSAIAESLNRLFGNVVGAATVIGQEEEQTERIGLQNQARALAGIEDEAGRTKAFVEAREAIGSDQNRVILDAYFTSARARIDAAEREVDRVDRETRGAHLGLQLETETVNFVRDQVKQNREAGLSVSEIDFADMLDPFMAEAAKNPGWEDDEDFVAGFSRQAARIMAREYGVEDARVDIQERVEGVRKAEDVFAAIVADPMTKKTSREDWGAAIEPLITAMDNAGYTPEQQRESIDVAVGMAMSSAVRDGKRGEENAKALRSWVNQNKGRASLSTADRGLSIVKASAAQEREAFINARIQNGEIQSVSDYHEISAEIKTMPKGTERDLMQLRADYAAFDHFNARIYAVDGNKEGTTTGALQMIHEDLKSARLPKKLRSRVEGEIDRRQEQIFDGMRTQSRARVEGAIEQMKDSLGDPAQAAEIVRRIIKIERQRSEKNWRGESVRLWPELEFPEGAEPEEPVTKLDSMYGDTYIAWRDEQAKRSGTLKGTDAYRNNDYSAIDFTPGADKKAQAEIDRLIMADSEQFGLANAAMTVYESAGALPKETWDRFLTDANSSDEARLASAARFFAAAAEENRAGFELYVANKTGKGGLMASLALIGVNEQDLVTSMIDMTESEASDAIGVVAALDAEGEIYARIREITDPGGPLHALGKGVVSSVSGFRLIEILDRPSMLGRMGVDFFNAAKSTLEAEVVDARATDAYRAVYAQKYATVRRFEVERGRDAETADQSARGAAEAEAGSMIQEQWRTGTIYGKRYLLRNEADEKTFHRGRELMERQVQYLVNRAELNTGFIGTAAEAIGALDNVTISFEREENIEGIRVATVHDQNFNPIGRIIVPDFDASGLVNDLELTLQKKEEGLAAAKVESLSQKHARWRFFQINASVFTAEDPVVAGVPPVNPFLDERPGVGEREIPPGLESVREILGREINAFEEGRRKRMFEIMDIIE